MSSFIPPIFTSFHFVIEINSTLDAPLAYLSFLHILILQLFKCIFNIAHSLPKKVMLSSTTFIVLIKLIISLT